MDVAEVFFRLPIRFESEMLALMRDQDTSLFLVLYQPPVQQVLLVLCVHVLSEEGEIPATL